MSTSYQEFVMTGLTLVSSLIASAMFMRRFRRYFQPRHKGESLRQFIKRARADEKLDTAAVVHMFGANSISAHWINLLFVLAFLWSVSEGLVSGMAGLLYLAIGAVATNSVARSARQANYQRLRWSERIWFRLFFALAWPLYIIKNRKPETD